MGAGLGVLTSLNGFRPKIPRVSADDLQGARIGNLGHLRLNLQTNDRPWMNTPIRADLITGEPGSPYFLTKPIRVLGNDTVQIALYNDIDAKPDGTNKPAIDAMLALVGYKLQARGR
jgi:hypothetical protein